MNSDGMDIVSVIFLGIAVVIFLYLRSILGTKTGHQRPYSNDNQDTTSQRNTTGRDDNVVSMPERKADTGPNRPIPEIDMSEMIEKYAPKDTPLNSALREITSKDQSFNPEQFMDGAERAYEMIIIAFSDGDKKQLKRLLAKDVFQGFSDAIDTRQAEDQFMTTQFVGFDKVTMLEASIEDKQTEITVKFKSSLIRYITDSQGEIVEGDEKDIEKITDIWTFARGINGRDPNWKLISTKSES